MNLSQINNLNLDANFDAEKYLKNNPEAKFFGQPFCKKHNVPEKYRLFLHYLLCNPRINTTSKTQAKHKPAKNKKQKGASKDLLINGQNIKHKTITNCYYDDCNSGFGDFIRGSCFLYSIIGELPRVNLCIDISNHSLGRYISTNSKDGIGLDTIIDVEKQVTPFEKHNNLYFNGMKRRIVKLFNRSEDKKINIFTNCFNLNSLMDKERLRLTIGCKNFIKNNIIFSEEVVDAFRNTELPSDYTVMHFRLGDRMTTYSSKDKVKDGNINNHKFSIENKEILKSIIKHYKKYQKNIVVLSDCNNIKKFISEKLSDNLKKKITVMHTNSQHSSNNPGSIDGYSVDKTKKQNNMFYVALDLIIIKNASSIVSSSVYPWGSGFCFWMAKVYDIPITFEKISSINPW